MRQYTKPVLNTLVVTKTRGGDSIEVNEGGYNGTLSNS